MPLQTIEPPRRLYRQIAEQLRVLIDAGEFAAGSRLPPERDLALQLGVSRPSVREALIALEVEGRVEVRMGSGIYVRAAADARSESVAHEEESPLETIRARQLIESELAAHAARHMKRAQVNGLREAIAVMEQEVAAGHMPTTGDRLFHLRIAEACQNSVLHRLVADLFDERHNPLFDRLNSHFESAQSWTVAISEHRAVVEAIASQSPEAAREAMSTHLTNSHNRFMASWQAGARKPAAPPVAAATKPASKKARTAKAAKPARSTRRAT
jgi:DNA-binding FadR family transcriptional regulator